MRQRQTNCPLMGVSVGFIFHLFPNDLLTGRVG